MSRMAIDSTGHRLLKSDGTQLMIEAGDPCCCGGGAPCDCLSGDGTGCASEACTTLTVTLGGACGPLSFTLNKIAPYTWQYDDGSKVVSLSCGEFGNAFWGCQVLFTSPPSCTFADDGCCFRWQAEPIASQTPAGGSVVWVYVGCEGQSAACDALAPTFSVACTP